MPRSIDRRKASQRARLAHVCICNPCLGKAHQDDQRLNNLFYRKSKLESVNETSALLSGFAIVSPVGIRLSYE